MAPFDAELYLRRLGEHTVLGITDEQRGFWRAICLRAHCEIYLFAAAMCGRMHKGCPGIQLTRLTGLPCAYGRAATGAGRAELAASERGVSRRA